MIKSKRIIALAAALTAMLFAAGCNLDALPPSPTATHAPTQAPAPTATATIAPTATIEPAITLKSGDQDVQAGDFDSAVSAYQVLVNQAGASAQDRAAAAYGVGQAALSAGLFSGAADALTTLITQFPNDSHIAEAHYLRGAAYLGLSRWNDAIADFQAYLTLRPGLIDSYVTERIGDAQLALGQTSAALQSYNQAASDTNRSLSSQLALRQRVAQVDASAGDSTDSVAQDDAILKLTQDKVYGAGIALQAAQTLLDAGDRQNGLVRMIQVFTNYPDRPEAYQAMNVLLQNNVGLDDLARGTVSYNYGDYLGAIDALNKFSEAHTVGEVPASLLLMLGQAYRQIGNTQASLITFQTIIDHYPTDPLFGQALLEQGETDSAASDDNGAIEQYMHIAGVYNYLPAAPEAMLQAGSLYAQANQPEQARAVLEKLADTYGDTTQAKDGLFLAASLAFNAKDFAAAERYYEELSVKTSGDDQAAAYFWVGRLALQDDDQKTAGEAFAQALKASPDSYFAARARDVVGGLAAFQPPKQVQFQFDEAAQQAQAEDWLRATYKITQSGSLSTLSADLQADPRFVRGNELWQVGQYDDAIAEFDNLVNASEDNALASYQLAVYFQSIGAYADSILAASYVIRNANVGTLDAPPYIARLRYPAYYLDVVQSAGKQVDPLLLLSMMRYESLFNPYLTGSAGEKGLLQMTSGVAEGIASQVNWPQDQALELSRPYVSIELGASDLAQQLQTFKNDTPVALVAYEAGAGRAQNWLDLSGGDPDQFMTAVDADTTRSYVQSIYSYYAIYRTLYGG